MRHSTLTVESPCSMLSTILRVGRVLVHCDLDLLPQDLSAVEIDVPPRIKVNDLGVSYLPRT
jgi:hypothetical protein